MNLPASFKRIKVEPKIESASDAKPAAGAGNNGGGKDAGRGKKQKNKNGNGNPVKNSTQDEDFATKAGESWQETFSKQFAHGRPSWDGKVKMCARWHIKGDCFDNCVRAISHVSKEKILADKKADFLTFMSKCRKAEKKSD